MAIKIIEGTAKDTMKMQFMAECIGGNGMSSFPQVSNVGNELQIHEISKVATYFRRNVAAYFRIIEDKDIHTYELRKYRNPECYDKVVLAEEEYKELLLAWENGNKTNEEFEKTTQNAKERNR